MYLKDELNRPNKFVVLELQVNMSIMKDRPYLLSQIYYMYKLLLMWTPERMWILYHGECFLGHLT